MLFSGVLALFLLLVLADLGSQILRGHTRIDRTGILCLGNDGLDLLQKIASLYQSFRRRVGIATPFLSGQQPDIPEGHPPEASTAVGKLANPVVLETIGRPQIDVVGATWIVCDRYPCRPAPRPR